LTYFYIICILACVSDEIWGLLSAKNLSDTHFQADYARVSGLSRKRLALIGFLLLLELGLGATTIEAAEKAVAAEPTGRITIAGTHFTVGTNRIWINGANTPWHVWNEFGGKFDSVWWDNHFQKLHENGINATRVWISCNGETGINIDPAGHVQGCTPEFWTNLDSLLEIAARRRVYIDATILSFDHFSYTHANYMRWRRMLLNETNIDSMVTNYVVPFVVRYRANPWLWSIDLCNEPDWIHEQERCGKMDWGPFQVYVAKAAAAIHAHSHVLVTVGITMGAKYLARPPGTNIFADATLQALAHAEPGARLDFYSPHYYDWEKPIGGNPFYMSPSDYPISPGKPIVIGECPAKGTAQHSITADYKGAFNHGWQGVMGWTSNGVDRNGSLENLAPATRTIYSEHPDLVFPKTPVVKIAN